MATTLMTPDAILDLRLRAARAAQERSRLALFATTLISFALLVGAWNGYLSFYRELAFDFRKLPDGPDVTGIRKLQESTLAEWVKSRWISISALGIEVGVNDAPTLGGVALLVALVWLYLCMRREHYTIAFLLHDYGDDRFDEGTKWGVFHGINLFTVFTTVGHSDEPLTTLHEPLPAEKEWAPSRWAIKAMYLLPTATLCVVIVLDIASLFRLSPARTSDNRLISMLISEGKYGEIANILLWEALAVALLFAVWQINRRVSRFGSATERILRDFLLQIPNLDRAVG
jgi:hypothetical protein